MQDVDEGQLTRVPAPADPNATVESLANPVPWMVTEVPPPVGPAEGLIPLTAGVPYSNWSARLVVLVPSGVVAVMSTVPDPAGEVAVQVVVEEHVTDVPAFAPKFTVVDAADPPGGRKFVPVIVTTVPPVGGPTSTDIEVTVGPPGPAEAGGARTTSPPNSDAIAEIRETARARRDAPLREPIDRELLICGGPPQLA